LIDYQSRDFNKFFLKFLRLSPILSMAYTPQT